MTEENNNQIANKPFFQEDEPIEQDYSKIQDSNSFYIDDENLDEENIDEDYEDDIDEEYQQTTSSKTNKNVLAVAAVIVVIILVILLFAAVKFLQAKNLFNLNKMGSQQANIETQVSDSENDMLENAFFDGTEGDSANQDNIMNVNFNNNGEATVIAGDGQEVQDTATVTNVASDETAKANDLFSSGLDSEQKDNNFSNMNEQSKNGANNSIMVAWNKGTRQNPFQLPENNMPVNVTSEKHKDVQFEIIEPPTKLVPDEHLTKLLQTQISGILYDASSPSAIVNLGGKDQFVKIGDVISGYKIKNITKTKVEIEYKNNSYVATVGELFVPGQLESQSEVANLNNKFAGRYKNKNVEE